MAGNDILHAASISPGVLISQQLGTTDTALYTVPANQSVKIAHGVLCNVTGTMPAPTGLAVGTLTTQSNIVPPTLSAPSTATTGGTLAAATYYYVATTTTAFGETAKSAEVSVTTTGTTSTVTLTWPAISGSTGTKIYRGTSAGGENVLVTTTSASATSYTDTGSSSGSATPPASATSTTMYYKVTAKNAVGETVASAEASALIAANQQAPLTWNAVPGAASYNLYRGTSAGGENGYFNTTVTNFTDLGGGAAGWLVPTTSSTAIASAVFLSVIKSGGTVGDTTHRVLNNYPLAANDSLPLGGAQPFLAGAMLGPGDIIAAYAQYAGAVNLVITGTVHA